MPYSSWHFLDTDAKIRKQTQGLDFTPDSPHSPNYRSKYHIYIADSPSQTGSDYQYGSYIVFCRKLTHDAFIHISTVSPK